MSTALSASPTADNVQTGLNKADTVTIANALKDALADSFTLYVKTLGVHWNVVGPNFFSLHKLTEEQYQDLAGAIDNIAERIRALGQIAPASFGDFRVASAIECETTIQNAEEMLTGLINDNEALTKRFRAFTAVAEEAEDVFTADLLTARIGQHEQNAWMLRALVA